MAIQFYNSLTQQKETFQPGDAARVRIYSCGPTVYNFNHLGNFRAYVFVDVLRRYLQYRGYGVDHTMNITDVEDKIIENAHKHGQNIREFTAPFVRAFLEDLEYLAIEDVEHRPRATEHIAAMIALMQSLEKSGHLYSVKGNVYFKLNSYDDYGRLSRLDMSELKTAADGRFAADEYTKEDARDFALWKAPATDYEERWPSPWGDGRPGWHLECSAMIREQYGANGVDIHTGGIDLLFPHHENEIAQSCCAYPSDNFVRYWLHNEHLLVEGKKMSKSLHNFFTLRDLTRPEAAEHAVVDESARRLVLRLIRRGHMPRAMRHLLMSTHYRQKLNFTFEALNASDQACERLQHALQRWKEIAGINAESEMTELMRVERERTHFDSQPERVKDDSKLVNTARLAFIRALDDDLNIARAFAALFDLVRSMNIKLEQNELKADEARDALVFLMHTNRVLAFLDFNAHENAAPDSGDDMDDDEAARIESLIAQRNTARAAKDFATADSIRDRLLNEGIQIKDTPDGTRWERV
ncbi:MAG: cysteine--tRNA ligase [Leptospiraceae bacterium]|nr:cysteine--tRNA ligase [Leptospiraceae bacterium]